MAMIECSYRKKFGNYSTSKVGVLDKQFKHIIFEVIDAEQTIP